MASPPKTIEEAPVLRTAWAGRVSRFCREEFLFYAEPGTGEIAGDEKKYRCSAAFTKSRTIDQAKSRLLCVAVSSTEDDLKKCEALERGKSFEEMRQTVDQVYGPEKTEKGMRAVQAAEQTQDGNLFDQLVSTLGVPFTAPPPSPTAAAPKPAWTPPPTLAAVPPAKVAQVQVPAPVRDVAAEVKKGLTAPPLTPLQISTFPVAVQECLKRSIVPRDEFKDALARFLDPLIQEVAEVDRRGLNNESRKLQEFCGVLENASVASAEKLIQGSSSIVLFFEALRKCLACDALPSTPSPLLKAVLEAA